MSKEMILMTDVQGLGVEGDVVTVADGYARNYLLPGNLAAPVTGATRRRLEKIQKERETKEVAQKAASEELVNKINEASCTITVRTEQEGKMFGSVTTSDIAVALEEQGIKLDKHKIQLEQPIRELGIFNVNVSVYPGVEATLRVWVVEE